MANDAEVGIGAGGNCEEGTVKRSLSKNLNGAGYLTPNTKKAFNHLWHAFTKAPILQHFDPKRYIPIETNASGYSIGEILSQLTLDDLSWWYPVAYYLQKMIPAKIRSKTHNSELLAIVEAFKTWGHYFEGCKHKVFVLTNHNNLWQFIDTKSLSFRQVC